MQFFPFYWEIIATSNMLIYEKRFASQDLNVTHGILFSNEKKMYFNP